MNSIVKRKKLIRNRVAIWEKLLIISLSILIIVPLIFTVSGSFMSSNEIAHYYGGGTGENIYFHILPDYPTSENFNEILFEDTTYLNRFWISVWLSAVIIIGQVAISVCAGYAFARYNFYFKKTLFVIIIVVMLLPSQVTMVSHYIVNDDLGLINNYLAIILPAVFTPFGVFLMRQFFITVPKNTVEAALIDGASEFKVFTRVVLPQRISGVISLVILSFVDCWNMVEQPLAFLRDAEKFPISILTSSMNEGAMGYIFAAGVLVLIPALLLFLICEDALVEGISTSVVK